MTPKNFLCISEEFKGASFMTALKAMGHRVFLLTKEAERHANWPREAIDEIFFRPETESAPHDRQSLVEGTAWLMRNHGIDRIVALDDFDVEDAALLREEFRIPGMGQTTARYFRDKLAMRMRARTFGIPVPAFSPLFRKSELERFCGAHAGPYVIKPRSEASAAGIEKVADLAEALRVFERLGESSYRYLVECFAPGTVYHVDALVQDGALEFVRSSAYVDPPLAIVRGGGLFQTRMLELASAESAELAELTTRVMDAFGMRYSASHTEFIRDDAGRFLFLETSSRVGGAYISNMVHHATGIDLWAEWARIEAAELTGREIELPRAGDGYGAVVLRAITEERADRSLFEGEAVREAVREVIDKPYHAGAVLAGATHAGVTEAQLEIARRLTERYG